MACPMEMLAGDSTDFRRVLLSLGLAIAPSSRARQLLTQYVQTARVGTRAVCTDRTGWHNGAYVLPDETIGEDDERVLLQTRGEPPKMRQAGSAEEWRDRVGRLCVGNSRLILAVSAAFAAPLMDLMGDESGGIHLVGASSTGKTAALRAAASVWGGPEYLLRWRATANALEAEAKSHNDALLILDELAQVDPRQAGEVAYMLANGSGKHRARRDGLARPVATWRLLFLSAGEVGLADHMAEVGKRARAGQEVRLADVPADAGAGHGLFECLHGYEDGARLADAIGSESQQYHGAIARAYLHQLTKIADEALRDGLKSARQDFLDSAVPSGAEGQAWRVGNRFGLIAAAGEFATALGLTGWPEGAALNSVTLCYRAWLDRRGGAGSHENVAALTQVRHFLELHGESRFGCLDATDRPVINRAGYRRFADGEMQYLFLPEVFRREVCAGLDYRHVARVLFDRGYLLINQPDRLIYKHRAAGSVYAVRGKIHE